MFPVLELVLEARNPERNVARSYRVEFGRDLIGDRVGIWRIDGRCRHRAGREGEKPPARSRPWRV